MTSEASPTASSKSMLPARFAGWQFAVVAAVIIAILLAAYWLVLHETYEPLLTASETDDAGEVVKLLEERKIPFELGADGRTVLVPEADLGKARLEVMGSELPMRGQVGFELFNQSDMGLTEFAQKINYQRALQGELARTILLLDGVKAVRVHLGLPERTLFRDERASPKASVTLILRPGAVLTEARVLGIQRLVAGAVPDMTADGVSILDGSGRVVSQSVAEAVGQVDAALEDYRRRASDAIAAAAPELRFSVQVSFRLSDAGPASAGSPNRAPLFVVITSPVSLSGDQRERIVQSLAVSAGISTAKGDTLSYVVGEPVAHSVPPAPMVPAGLSGRDRVVSETPAPSQPASGGNGVSLWWALLPLAAALVAIAWFRDRRRVAAASEQRIEDFAAVLKDRLATEAQAAQ